VVAETGDVLREAKLQARERARQTGSSKRTSRRERNDYHINSGVLVPVWTQFAWERLSGTGV
jgi:chorismate synthase